MLDRTRKLWEKQDRHEGDRGCLFSAVDEVIDASQLLCPGSHVDPVASFVWPSVTRVDVDRRAQQFFADPAGVA